MNLFATVLTHSAPSANYRGESEENRTVIQKITSGRFEYAIISPEAIRNALRETLAAYGAPVQPRTPPQRGSARCPLQGLPIPRVLRGRFLLWLPRC